MAVLFQSKPEQWDLRRYFEPGQYVSWYVSRYQASMYPGVLVLLWEAQGSKQQAVRGLYGWGITTDNVKPDANGRMRIRLQYIERWVSEADKNLPLEEHVAPIPANDVLSLPSWKDTHLLAVMPSGTNFLVSARQLEELATQIVRFRYPMSQFQQAVELDLEGERLNWDAFTPQLSFEAKE
jgi:hypothetical protein